MIEMKTELMRLQRNVNWIYTEAAATSRLNLSPMLEDVNETRTPLGSVKD